MFENISETISNAAKNVGEFVMENKGKIALAGAAIAVGYVYRNEIADWANGLTSKVAEVPITEIGEAVVIDVVPSV